jgi:hypothetical protein
MVKSPLFSCLFSIAPALFTVNHFSRNPLENNPADVFRESDRVSLGPFAHTLRRLFGQRVAVVALFELAESAGDQVAVEFIFHQQSLSLLRKYRNCNITIIPTQKLGGTWVWLFYKEGKKEK